MSYMKNILLAIVVISFISVILAPLDVFSEQNEIILINEVETNPPGIDSGGAKEYVELYNPSENDVDVGGWILSPSKFSYKSYTIPENTVISKHGFLVLTHVGFWFSDSGDSVDLINASGKLIDSSPELQDLENNMMTWQRITDGLDSNSDFDWMMKLSTPNSSNGKKIDIVDDIPISVDVSFNKHDFVFDEVLKISGSVSKEVFVEKPTFSQSAVHIKINGPDNFETFFTLYPDHQLKFDSTVKLQNVLGFSIGNYVVDIDYADFSITENFSINSKQLSSTEIPELEFLIDSNELTYHSGDIVEVSGMISKLGYQSRVDYDITDPFGNYFNSGSVFPDQSGKFDFKIFIPDTNVNFGKFDILLSYSESNSYGISSVLKTTVSSFVISEEVKDDSILSLYSEKQAYGLGEVVKLTGKSNHVWVPTLNLMILQTDEPYAFGKKSDNKEIKTPFKILDVVRLDGDGTFSYDFKIPNNPKNLGSYKISLYEDLGRTNIKLVVTDDPEHYDFSTEPLSLFVEKLSYLPNEQLQISGKILSIKERTGDLLPASVNISFFDSNGRQITVKQCPSNASRCTVEQQVDWPYTISAMPDQFGNFYSSTPLSYGLFPEGKYSIKATFEGLSTVKLFDVIPLEKSDVIEKINPITLTLDKTSYDVGDTIYVSGTVDLAKLHSYSSDVHSTSQTTNYATAAKSQVNVVIPYPLYLTTGSTGSVKTSTTEEYTGAGVEGVDTGKGSYDGTVTYLSTTRLLQGFESNIHPDDLGNFNTSFKLRPGVFFDGQYLIRATYFGNNIEIPFNVNDNSLVGGKPPILNLSTDKTQYVLGDTVKILGSIEHIFYFDAVKLAIHNENQSKLNCFTMECGLGDFVKQIMVNESTGTFSYDYTIPEKLENLGTYSLIAETHFGYTKYQFDVVESLPSVIPPESFLAKKIIDKVSRIQDSSIEIKINEKTIEQEKLFPRVLQGSLFSPIRGAESDVNLTLITDSGVCVIGQDTSCLISDSTRAPGKIFEIIQLEGKSYKVRYSGPDAKLEKFSILPSDDAEVLKNSSWNVEIIKDSQPSRFYYKILYLKTE